MFVLNFVFSLAKHLIIIVGTLACCAFALGKPGPFRWAAGKIEKRNMKNISCSYCHH